MDPVPVIWSSDSHFVLASNGANAAFLLNVARRTKRRYDLRDEPLGGGAFSPDATRLVLAYGGSSREDATLHLVRIGEATRKTLWTGEFPVWGKTGIAAFASPNQIWFARKPGESPHIVAHSSGLPVSVSSNGRTLLLAEGNEFVPNHAVLVDPVAKRAKRLSQSFQTVNGLSRDGRHVLGVVGGRVVDIEGDGDVHTLVKDGLQPSWNK